MRMRIAAAIAALVLVGAACGDDDDDSVSDDAQAVCESLTNLETTLAQVAGADVDANSTTVDDVQNALQSVESDVEAVQDAQDTLSTEVRTSIQSAFSDFTSAIQDIPGDSTLAEAGASIEAAQTAFQQAVAATLSEVSCETATTTN